LKAGFTLNTGLQTTLTAEVGLVLPKKGWMGIMRGSHFWLLSLCVTVVALCLVSATFAATVVVKPSNMNGWIAGAFQGLDEYASEPTCAFSNTIAPPYLDGL
jgi:hypothetical protein